jgi:uncharacterized repeat protein (TIGR03833 family)
MSRVPTISEVVRGALVNIVLKADQPTGRTVQGAVSQVLTRGNHPRGIKVRLADGRVGRVQSIAAGMAPSEFPRQPPEGSREAAGADVRFADAGLGGRRQYRDARLEQEQPASTQTIGLDAYIKPAKKRGKRNAAGSATAGATAVGDTGVQVSEPARQPSGELDELACPVCGAFRGDAAALTHHVQSHFDD